jgi:hypothetical protein
VYNAAIMSDSGASFGGKTGRRFEGAGGTPGGVGEFIIGVAVAAIGFFLLFSQVQVRSSYWNFPFFGGAGRSFGVSLVPLLFGIGVLFVNGKSIIGWFLTVGGLLLILAGILVNLDIHFHGASLMSTLIMFGCIAAGFGLIVKALRPHRSKRAREASSE